jgi:predicted Zn-dependent protease
LTQIEQMLKADPKDIFLNFSLAMEYVKEGRGDDAVAQFTKVTELDPGYISAYYQQANTLVGLGRNADAKPVLERGLEAARKANDAHMVDKLSQMLALLK